MALSAEGNDVVIESKFHYFVAVSGFLAVSGMAAYELWKIFAFSLI
jgi:hypothetical protein